MTFKINPYYRLFMNTILLHCLICFLHACFAEESLLVYICMLYIGVLIFGQYAIRHRIHNPAAYLLLHILLIAPCALFYNFSILDLVIVGLFAVTLTGLSFKKSLNTKNDVIESEDTISPFITLLLPFFSIAGSYYKLPFYTRLVFFEAVPFLILFVCYTFNVNENLYIRDHCPTASIPAKRILATTAGIKSFFIIIVVTVMLLVMGINISIPDFSHNSGASTINPSVSEDTQYEYNNKYPDLSELHEGVKSPSAFAVVLSYIFIGIITLAGIVLLFILILSALRTLRSSLSPKKQSSTFFEEDEITVESLSFRFLVRHHAFNRPVTNSDKIRKLFKNAIIKKIRHSRKLHLGSELASKTPTEINEALSTSAASYPDEVISLYQEARYSDHDITTDTVKKMYRQLHKKD